MKIHHNTLKRAAAHGLEITQSHGTFFVFRFGEAGTDNHALASAKDPKDALDLALVELAQSKAEAAGKMGGDAKPKKPKSSRKPKKAKRRADDEEGDEDEEPSRSIVKAKYRDKYRPHKMTCGDDIAKKARDKFMTLRDEDTGKPRLDFERFVKFAKVNECWVEGYRSLKDRHGNRNNGLIRMNVVNRLRARVRKGEKIDWGA